MGSDGGNLLTTRDPFGRGICERGMDCILWRLMEAGPSGALISIRDRLFRNKTAYIGGEEGGQKTALDEKNSHAARGNRKG